MYLVLRQPVKRIQMGITLKRETIMTWDALPVRMKLHTPAQQVLIFKNRSTGHCFVCVCYSCHATKSGSLFCLWDKKETHWTMSSTIVMTHLVDTHSVHLGISYYATFKSLPSLHRATYPLQPTLMWWTVVAVASRMPAAQPLSGVTYRCTQYTVQLSIIHAKLLPSRVGYCCGIELHRRIIATLVHAIH